MKLRFRSRHADFDTDDSAEKTTAMEQQEAMEEQEEPEQQALELPELDQLKAELERENYKSRYLSVLRSTIYTLIVVAAVAVLVATIWMPVLQTYGSSMSPTLEESDIVVSV